MAKAYLYLLIPVMLQLDGVCWALGGACSAAMAAGRIDPSCSAQVANAIAVVAYFGDVKGAGADACQAACTAFGIDLCHYAAELDARSAEKSLRSSSAC